MERLGSGGDSDAEFGGKRDQRNHGTTTTTTITTTSIGNVGNRVFHYVWHVGTMLLILGNLIGLCVISAQLEVSRVAVSSVWNASHSNLSVMNTSPRLILIPMKSIDRTDLNADKALRVKRSNDGEVLVRRKRLAPLILGVLIGGGASFGYLGGIGAGIAIANRIREIEESHEDEESSGDEGSGEEEYYDPTSGMEEEDEPLWVPYQEGDEQDMMDIWKIIDEAAPGIVFEGAKNGLENTEDDSDGEMRDFRARRHLKVGD